jgi:translation initiation factor 1
MAKKKIDVSERELSAGQSLGDFLSNAGLNISKDAHVETDPEPIKPKVPSKQKDPLYLRIEKKGRQGKVVTIVGGFTGLTGVIEDLAKKLKSQCGVGGSVKDREIVMQGDLRKKLTELLRKEGYSVK